MKNIEKLNELFSSQTFVDRIKDLDNLPAIYDVVKVEAPEVTMEELDEYLERVSDLMDQGEISEDKLDNVAGGGIGLALGIVTGVLATFGSVHGAGYAIGKYRAHKQNNKKKKR